MTQPQFMIVFINVLPCWASKTDGSLFSVEGRIISSYENRPIAGAKVSLKGDSESVGANKYGQFVIHPCTVPATLEFSAEGYIKQEISLTPPRDAPLLITMTNYRFDADSPGSPGTTENTGNTDNGKCRNR